ncbi:FCD domain-containing protein [Svornostia abyssi]|uniref:FCD domain-containing protein n=1 Tax=Svornostia abyssi TaxID=2898438 RepID=A0ABY5PG37_9ACTN|nr:FCD domain-containing protein [Parviterribacteraceae bacterium J379]
MRRFEESTWQGLPCDGPLRELREALIFGHWLPGEPLDPDEVALELSAPADALPSAFAVLESEGLAQRQPDGTYRVAPIERRATIQFLEVVRALSVRSYALGVRAVTDADLRIMRQVLRAYELTDADREPATAVMETFVFNRPIHEAHGNEELIRQLDLLRPRMERIAMLVYPANATALGYDTLKGVLEALERDDPDAALKLFEDGVDHAIRTIELLPDSAFEELAAS